MFAHAMISTRLIVTITSVTTGFSPRSSGKKVPGAIVARLALAAGNAAANRAATTDTS